MSEIDFSNIDDWQLLRHERNFILNKSDRKMLWDSSLTDAKKQEWATYRQQLRDLPANTDDPRNVIWPTQPS